MRSIMTLHADDTQLFTVVPGREHKGATQVLFRHFGYKPFSRRNALSTIREELDSDDTATTEEARTWFEEELDDENLTVFQY